MEHSEGVQGNWPPGMRGDGQERALTNQNRCRPLCHRCLDWLGYCPGQVIIPLWKTSKCYHNTRQQGLGEKTVSENPWDHFCWSHGKTEEPHVESRNHSLCGLSVSDTQTGMYLTSGSYHFRAKENGLCKQSLGMYLANYLLSSVTEGTWCGAVRATEYSLASVTESLAPRAKLSQQSVWEIKAQSLHHRAKEQTALQNFIGRGEFIRNLDMEWELQVCFVEEAALELA